VTVAHAPLTLPSLCINHAAEMLLCNLSVVVCCRATRGV